MNERLFVVIFLVLFILGCGVSKNEHQALLKKHEELKTENHLLKKEVTSLKKQIDEIKFGSEKLLIKAKNLFNEKYFQNAKTTINTLLKKHPESKEANEAKRLLAKIENEIKKEATAEKQRIALATKQMKKKYDQIEKITWYQDKSTPSTVSYTQVYLYFGKFDNGILTPTRLVINLNRDIGDSWLFVQNYTFMIDGEKYSISPEFNEIRRDNSSYSLWETCDVPTSRSQVNTVVQALINSKKAILRFNGQQYYFDYTIPESQKKRMRNVLTAYKTMGG